MKTGSYAISGRLRRRAYLFNQSNSLGGTGGGRADTPENLRGIDIHSGKLSCHTPEADAAITRFQGDGALRRRAANQATPTVERGAWV